VTNDDGPPSDHSSPYVMALVKSLKENTDWTVSVAVPHVQRSWIGKAHMIGQTITAQYITVSDDPFNFEYEGPYDTPTNNENEWALLDGTPATCTNIGIHHLFPQKPPVDLVISGPNFGRNSTALFIMSSGTVGAAMEAALSGVKGVGISFAFDTRELVTSAVTRAVDTSVKVVKELLKLWPDDNSVDLYSVNVPLSAFGPNTTGLPKAMYTDILENRWGSCFEPDVPESSTAAGKIQFKWRPRFHAVYQSVEESEPGNDGWAVANNIISVTPLKAVYKSVNIRGEIKFSNPIHVCIHVCIDYPRSSYIGTHMTKAIARYIPEAELTCNKDCDYFVHIAEYEQLDFDRIMSDQHYIACSYVYRKALIRKNYLANCVALYRAKNPDSLLASSFPETHNLEVDYAEFLDDALDDAYELRYAIDNENCQWILKPSMSDKGQGIRIFSTIEQLQDIFDAFEEENDSEDDEDENDENDSNNGIVISHLRHFIVQKYITDPLLLDNRKFHLRVYVVCSGAITVYVGKRILALFAGDRYDAEDIYSLTAHLTNTCLQENPVDSVREFSGLDIPMDKKEHIYAQIKVIVKEVFEAALAADRMSFQPLPNCFEFYGLDFLVDADCKPWLLEVNAYPDFTQTGDSLSTIVASVFAGAVATCVRPL
ncbi:hypothetical protein CANCADRAFT_13040, partial [Tortispora caseinolytica NRRL Y-17796]